MLGFLVDNTAPTITVNSPTEGQTFTNTEASFGLTVLDNNQGISSLGYYLDNGTTINVFNITSATLQIGAPGVSITQTNTTNLTGTRSIKFSVNDTLGNVRNSSSVTFTAISTVDFLGANLTIKTINGNNMSNVSFIDSNNALLTGVANIEQTLKLFVVLNATGGANVTINFNGTAANWNKTTQV